MATDRIPLVDYLVLGDEPWLEANECRNCGARFFDRRNSCAACFGTDFERVRIASEGEVRAFTIVTMAAPGIPVPFASAIVDCAGTTVRGNLVNVEPDPQRLHTGMKVRLTTYSMGTDSQGTEAIGYGFEPISAEDHD
ncbi:MAG TPA: OB-fold domain-containing protein [Amycolatopsis sp.]|nr:OB-fold domain-containing protein [Amycolatopsis sp.]